MIPLVSPKSFLFSLIAFYLRGNIFPSMMFPQVTPFLLTSRLFITSSTSLTPKFVWQSFAGVPGFFP